MISILSFVLCALVFAVVSAKEQNTPPHIIMILLDDVGWADVSFHQGKIPTPFMDQISESGVRFNQHYTSPTCTPTRASLMTGRYAAMTGLNMAMVPGSPVGLQDNLTTLPELLLKQNYETHMVGKWHLGHSRWKQTPVGRGFQSHTGSFMWDLDSYTKQMYREAWAPGAVDWIKAYSNGTFSHYANSKHATLAIADESIKVMESHAESYATKEKSPDKPLFLYIAFTAAHSPLQPEPQHLAKCSHFAHEWRRLFCGMVVGLDEAILNISQASQKLLGQNVVLVLSSDNGGSTWFGSVNAPLRSGKTTPFEGGVRTVAFAKDFTPDGRYLGTGGRTYPGLLHISDWMPTFLKMAGMSENEISGLGLDGVDVAAAIRSDAESPRDEILLEMYYPNETVFGEEWALGLRQGKWKLIEGFVRDPHYYYESSTNALNSTDTTLVAPFFQWFIFCYERIFGIGPVDTTRVAITHYLAHREYLQGPLTLLFDIQNDPEETKNVAHSHPEVVAQMHKRLQDLRDKRPRQQEAWMQLSPENWIKTMVPGDCSEQPQVPSHLCRFTHPWLSDNDPDDKLPLFHARDSINKAQNVTNIFLGVFSVIALALPIHFCWFCFCRSPPRKEKEE